MSRHNTTDSSVYPVPPTAQSYSDDSLRVLNEGLAKTVAELGSPRSAKRPLDEDAERERRPSAKKQKEGDFDDIEPLVDAQGMLHCSHPKRDERCNSLTFSDRAAWEQHNDQHVRPFRCDEPSCANLRGFTYSGGLLRHQREVHKKFGGPKQMLTCPYPYCKRNTGPGFTRKENLQEHIRRVHKPAAEMRSTESAEQQTHDLGVEHDQHRPMLSDSQGNMLQPASAPLAQSQAPISSPTAAVDSATTNGDTGRRRSFDLSSSIFPNAPNFPSTRHPRAQEPHSKVNTNGYVEPQAQIDHERLQTEVLQLRHMQQQMNDQVAYLTSLLHDRDQTISDLKQQIDILTENAAQARPIDPSLQQA